MWRECQAGRPEIFFTYLKLNVSRLRQPGAVRAQPCLFQVMLENFKYH